MRKSIRELTLLALFSVSFSACYEINDSNDPTPLQLYPNTAAIQEGQRQSVLFSLTESSTSPVSLFVTSMQPDVVAVSQNYYQINPSQWQIFQSVDFICIDDQINRSNPNVEIQFKLTSHDPNFNDKVMSAVVTCIDNDITTPGSSTINPGNQTDPTNPGNQTDPTNPGNQTDPTNPGNQTDPTNPLNPITPINPNQPQIPTNPDGTPGILVSPSIGLVTSETGNTASFNVILTGQPTADVIIPVVSSDTSEGIPNVSSLVFNASNWNQAQIVTVTGLDDNEQDGDIIYEIILGPAQSQDTRYQNMPINTHVQCTNTDNETPNVAASFSISASSLKIYESGASAKFTIVPNTAPVSAITVNISVTDTTEATVSPNQVTFTPQNWNIPQVITLTGLSDHTMDGSQNYYVSFTVYSQDERYNNFSITPVEATTYDSDTPTGETVTIRTMAANITSGRDQAYSEGHGIRIFQALKPDIVMIQEFNMYSGNDDKPEDIRLLVDTAFGPEFEYYQGNGQIPNGIISRFPIIDHGYWNSNVSSVSNRNWEWAVIDLPGPKELLAVSVHLSTSDNSTEIPALTKKIQNKIAADKERGQEYFVMIGGDFNTKNRNSVTSNMKAVFKTSAPYPVDQKGNSNTNGARQYPYDYLLCSPDWCNYEIPIIIGEHSYSNGHVFDSRVYSSLNELGDVPPVQAKDSDAQNMQHMAIIRDFRYTY